MGMWGTPSVPKAFLLIFLLLPPAIPIRCYTDLEATQVLEPKKNKIYLPRNKQEDLIYIDIVDISLGPHIPKRLFLYEAIPIWPPCYIPHQSPSRTHFQHIFQILSPGRNWDPTLHISLGYLVPCSQ